MDSRDYAEDFVLHLSRSYFVGLSFLAESGARRNDERFLVARGKNTFLRSISVGDPFKIRKAGNYGRDLSAYQVYLTCALHAFSYRDVPLSREFSSTPFS